ncbi:uracil-DNA glycosylase family protein [Aquimarina sp. ERC-38]|nr:uracil-DNA glycosylase family protein [Aquimarina sp. ERC-38]
MQKLLSEIRSCTLCSEHLPLGPNPIISASKSTKIALVSQAPGSIAHKSGIPWDDPGGRELKRWLQVTEDVFYNPDNFGIIPIGFCYPGKGKSGDLPPRPECAPLWHSSVFSELNHLKIRFLIGQYSQKYYLGKKAKRTLTETVKNFKEYLPDYFPLPHPSPRNRIWRAKNPWFEQEVLPELRVLVKEILKV